MLAFTLEMRQFSAKINRIHWMKVGKNYNTTKTQRHRLISIFANADWQSIPRAGITLGMMPALGIESAIKELRIPKVSHIVVSNELAPYGLYGIRGHYKSETVDIWVIDEGSYLRTVAAVVKPKTFN